MRRTLTALLVATAVVGATSGTVVAQLVVDRDRAGSDPSTVGPAAVPDARADEVLWTTRYRLHDGDRVVKVALPGVPVGLQRAAEGWVVSTTRDSDDLRARQTSVVSPDGTLRTLAMTEGDGDVDPSGTRYVAQALDGSGYGVWDLASGERTDSVTVGRDPAQEGVAGAQFVDLDTVATTWSGQDGAQEVLTSDLGSDDRTVVADDVFGPWAISPDGRWFAGSLPAVVDGEADVGCVVIRPVDGGSAGRTDCGGWFPGYPSFASDSSAVLTVPPYAAIDEDSQDDYYFRPVPTGDLPAPDRVPTPTSTFDSVMLGPGEVVSLGSAGGDLGTSVGGDLLEGFGFDGAAEPEPEGPDPELQTLVQRCAVGSGCEVVGRADVEFRYATLGTPY